MNYPQPALARVDEILVWYRLHNWLAHEEDYCADVLEDIVRTSFETAGGYKFQGKLLKGSPGALDGVYEFGPETIGCAVKNIREWIYPMSEEVWVMIKKCLTIDAVPFLVSRKTSFMTRNILSELGIMYFDVFRQVFSQRVAHLLADIQHKDRLGYKDVIAVDIEANPHLVNYLKNTLPDEIADRRTQWNRYHDLLQYLAFKQALGDTKTTDEERSEYFKELYRELLYEQEDDDGYPDQEPEDP